MAKLGCCQTCAPRGLRFRDGTCLHGAEKEAQQPLPRRRLVEHAADERRLCRLVEERVETRARRVDSLEVEARDGRVSRDELHQMQIPALIKSAGERVSHVREMQHPAGVNRGLVLRALLLAE